MSSRFIAIRHGETVWNQTRRQQGHSNSDLTETGLMQARSAGEALRKLPISRIISSDLGRAVQTAAIISDILSKTFTTDPRLRERNLGIFEGLTMEEFEEQYPSESASFKTRDPQYRIPNGESIREHYERCIPFVEDACARFRGETLLFVTHGGVLSRLFQKALDLPLTSKGKFSLFNTSINKFLVDDSNRWKLETWGDINHLSGNGSLPLDEG